MIRVSVAVGRVRMQQRIIQRTVPGGVSDITLSHGAALGNLVLEWNPPDFDGFSAITDYEYKLEWQKPNGNRYPPWVSWYDADEEDDWRSVGRSMTTRRKLLTGLHRNTRYRVTIRAVNNEGESTSLSYKYKVTE